MLLLELDDHLTYPPPPVWLNRIYSMPSCCTLSGRHGFRVGILLVNQRTGLLEVEGGR